MTVNKLLKVENLTIGFKSDNDFSIVVDNISFQIEKGKAMGLVGESGCGKTVTSLSIMKLLPSKSGKISSGKILLNTTDSGKLDLINLSNKQMQVIRGKQIGMIFQEPMSSLNPVMKCGRQVAETMLWHKFVSPSIVKQKVIELFREVKLPMPEKIYNSYPHQLSGGQRQRVMIAMAISCRPALLIADEPTTALDVTVQKNILELLKELQKKHNMSILFITHDLGVVKSIADIVSVMYQGKIVESGPIDEVFSNPSHPYTKSLISCRPSLHSRPLRLPVINDFITNDASGNTTLKENISAHIKEISAAERKARHEKIYSKPPALIVENLKTSFIVSRNILGKPLKVYKAVDDMSFSVFEGETLGLVGESGCGKTTLGRTIIRLIDPQEGKIVYNGVELSGLNNKDLKKLRPKIQIIFQDPYSSLTPGMQIGKAIVEPMKAHNILSSDKLRKLKAIDLLEKVGLHEKHFYRYPHEFSGGQRQRICIARALALKPDFVICDESVSSLDVSVQAQVLNLLNQLKEDYNLTYIFISHDMAVVKYMSDRIMVMQQGKIAELAEADELYNNPATDYTSTLINAIPE